MERARASTRAYRPGRQMASLTRSTGLVPRHRGFDRLDVSLQYGQILWRNENGDAARHARLPTNEAGALEGEDHLVDGWWRHAEVTLHLPFGRGAPMHAGVGIDESQILALLWGETAPVFARHLTHQSIRPGLRKGGPHECTLSCDVDPRRAQCARSAIERRQAAGAQAQEGTNPARRGCPRQR